MGLFHKEHLSSLQQGTGRWYWFSLISRAITVRGGLIRRDKWDRVSLPPGLAQINTQHIRDVMLGKQGGATQHFYIINFPQIWRWFSPLLWSPEECYTLQVIQWSVQEYCCTNINISQRISLLRRMAGTSLQRRLRDEWEKLTGVIEIVLAEIGRSGVEVVWF